MVDSETTEDPANGQLAVAPGSYHPSGWSGFRWWDGSTWTQATSDPFTGAGVAMPRTHPLAVASLCCSIGGWFTLGISAIVGVVLGNRARREIRASGGILVGEGLAKAGVVVGWVLIGFYAVLLVLLVIAGAPTN